MKKHICIISLFLATALSAGENSFAPWQRDVTVGDEMVHVHRKGRHHHGETGSTVFSGFQGGSWLLIRFFQVVISPLDGPSCRYHPVCSVYGRQAVERYGSLLGSIMAGERILRCNPWGKGGYDPVVPLSREE